MSLPSYKNPLDSMWSHEVYSTLWRLELAIFTEKHFSTRDISLLRKHPDKRISDAIKIAEIEHKLGSKDPIHKLYYKELAKII